eukprot:1178462-Prorocentrum_minimum.AAC.1
MSRHAQHHNNERTGNGTSTSVPIAWNPPTSECGIRWENGSDLQYQQYQQQRPGEHRRGCERGRGAAAIDSVFGGVGGVGGVVIVVLRLLRPPQNLFSGHACVVVHLPERHDADVQRVLLDGVRQRRGGHVDQEVPFVARDAGLGAVSCLRAADLLARVLVDKAHGAAANVLVAFAAEDADGLRPVVDAVARQAVVCRELPAPHDGDVLGVRRVGHRRPDVVLHLAVQRARGEVLHNAAGGRRRARVAAVDTALCGVLVGAVLAAALDAREPVLDAADVDEVEVAHRVPLAFDGERPLLAVGAVEEPVLAAAVLRALAEALDAADEVVHVELAQRHRHELAVAAVRLAHDVGGGVQPAHGHTRRVRARQREPGVHDVPRRHWHWRADARRGEDAGLARHRHGHVARGFSTRVVEQVLGEARVAPPVARILAQIARP